MSGPVSSLTVSAATPKCRHTCDVAAFKSAMKGNALLSASRRAAERASVVASAGRVRSAKHFFTRVTAKVATAVRTLINDGIADGRAANKISEAFSVAAPG